MENSTLLTIPCLSKELKLLGYQKLPFKVIPVTNKHTICANKPVLDDEWSSEEEDNTTECKIKYHNGKMLQSLVNVCFELIKNIKSFNQYHEDHAMDRLAFDNKKINRQLILTRSNLNTIENEFAAHKEKYRQLQEKYDKLENKLSSKTKECVRQTKEHASSEQQLHHSLNKTSNEVKHLNNVLWKKFNVVHITCIEDNLLDLQLRDTQLTKLWSKVKFTSSASSREDILKHTICQFESNNRRLIEENIELRSIVMSSLIGLFDIIDDIRLKFNLNLRLTRSQVKRLLTTSSLDLDSVKQHLEYCVSLCTLLMKKYEKHSFVIENDVFVCVSDVLQDLMIS